MPTAEGKIQGNVIDWLKSRFIKTIRMVFRQGAAAGWPDTLVLLPGGRPAFIEFKRPGKKPTAKQREKIEWLEDNGYRVAWFDNEDEAKEWLDGLRREDAEGGS